MSFNSFLRCICIVTTVAMSQFAAAQVIPRPTSVAFNFIDDDNFDIGTWDSDVENGIVPQANWNQYEAAQSPLNYTDIESVVDSDAQPSPVQFSSTFLFSSDSEQLGNIADKLFNGILFARGSVNAEINFEGIPYDDYDVYVYIASSAELAISELTCRVGEAVREVAKVRPTLLGVEGSFLQRRRVLADRLTIVRANTVKLSGFVDDHFSLSLDPVFGSSGIAAVQIVDRLADGDNDGLQDWWELQHNIFSPSADADGDGLNNIGEFLLGSDPNKGDSDDDGLSDRVESNTGVFVDINNTGTDPNFADSDEDGLSDYSEVFDVNPSNPNLVDSDGDTVPDFEERENGTPSLVENAGIPLPQVSTTSSFLWEVSDVQIRWNHNMIWNNSNFSLSDHDIARVQVQNLEQSNINTNVLLSTFAVGLREREGDVVSYIFSRADGGFEINNRSSVADYGTEDLTEKCGFAGVGAADYSDLLTFSVSAQKNSNDSNWQLTFSIANQKTGEDVFRSRYDDVVPDSSITDGSASWRNAVRDNVPTFLTENDTEVIIASSSVSSLAGFEDSLDDNNDGIPDSWNTFYGVSDPNGDSDGDLLTNYQEYLAGTDPTKRDSDGDGFTDAQEANLFSDPNNESSSPPLFALPPSRGGSDFDGNLLPDLWEGLYSDGFSLSADADPDSDGMTNYEEAIAGTNPFDSESSFYLNLALIDDLVEVSWPALNYKQTTLLMTDLEGETDVYEGGLSTDGQSIFAEMERTAEKQFFYAEAEDVDSDSDGVTDAEEAILGTNPNSANSSRRSALASDGEHIITVSGDYATLADKYSNRSVLAAGGVTEPGVLTPQEASRFLMQATFGPIGSDIEELREMGIEAWLDEQILNKPITEYENEVVRYHEDLNGARVLDGLYNVAENSINESLVRGPNISSVFATAAIKGEDQLRQRVAFALSQIFVVSQRNFQLQESTQVLGDYYDMLLTHSFGNYLDLLKAVSRHPAMGIYLSSIANLPPDPSINRYPDENYAREVMQLFTIGIHEMNQDGTLKVDNGLLIETYDQGDVTEIARVMTGLARDRGIGTRFSGSNYLPMRMFSQFHDFEEKTFLGYTIPARDVTNENAEQDLDDLLTFLFDHDNTPPFVSRALIQFFVTDNPSPDYIRRVADVFVNNGSGERGDLGAVIKTILTDVEARDIQVANNVPEFGRLRDPLIRVMHLSRILRMDKHQEIYWWEPIEQITEAIAQTPLNATSVFNFYSPDYKPVGILMENNLNGGPFQILDNSTSVALPNFLWETITEGFQRSWGGTTYDLPPFYDELIPYADDNASLVDYINLVACAGRMTTASRTSILETISDPALEGPENRIHKICIALYGACIIPESAITR